MQFAVKNPTSSQAKHLETWFSTLFKKFGSRSYYQPGRSSTAFSHMLSNNRINGDGALFLTIAPTTWKYGIFWRLVKPITSNYGYDNITFDHIPNTNSLRTAQKYASPNADCLTYLLLLKGIVSLLGIPNSDMFVMTSKVASTPNFDTNGKPSELRHRGQLGRQNILFVANEASTAGNPHAHFKCYNSMNSKFIETIAENKEYNKLFGKYMNSLILNELTYERTYNNKENYQDPTDIWKSKEEVLQPGKSITLPITNKEFNEATQNPINNFWITVNKKTHPTINHQDHNFSCFKNKELICRFKMPALTWNQISGIIQLILDENDKGNFHILRDIEPMKVSHDNNILQFQKDSRFLIFNTTKRVRDDKQLRDPTIPDTMKIDMKEIGPYINDNDNSRENALISPCNVVILVSCGGGGILHNNLQHIHKGGMGDISYIAKYFTKGGGELKEVLVLVHEVSFVRSLLPQNITTCTYLIKFIYFCQKSEYN